jgi:ArsR family transcriptional regulator
MELIKAVAALGALAQESRLSIFRLLIEQGEEGMAAGDIAQHIGSPSNTLSSHLGILSRSGLTQSRRAGRSIIYSVHLEGVQRLLAYLMQDCCGGRPELCGPLLKPKKRRKA